MYLQLKRIKMIKYIFLILFFTHMFFMGSFAHSKPFLDNVYHYIENVNVYELGQEFPHVPIVPYSSLKDALSFHVKE